MSVGLVHNPTLLQQARHGKKRRRYLGRAALYAKAHVETVLKDLTADSVHIPANIGGDGSKTPRRRRKAQLSTAYLSKFAPGQARDAKGRWTREQAQAKLEQHLTGLLAEHGLKTTGKGQTASNINVARFSSKRALEMRPKERDKWLRSKLQTHGVLLEQGHKFPARSLDFIPKPVKDVALRYGPAAVGATAGGVAGFAAGGPAGAVLGAATGANAGETLRTNFVGDKVKKMLFDKRFFSAARRRKLTQTGDAMPGGRYPIKNQKDLNNAARLSGHSSDQAAVRAHIRDEAKKHGLSLPDSYAKRRVREILYGAVS